MKVLHVIQRYAPAQLTGSERAFVVLCEALAKRYSSIEVITSDATIGEGFYDPRVSCFQKKTETIHGVKVTRLSVNWFLASLYYVVNRLLGNLSWPWLRMQSFGPQLIGLSSAIRSKQPDLVHVSPMPMSHVYATVTIARRLGVPLVITPTMHFEDPRFDNRLIYSLLNQADHVITHTEFEKNELTKHGIDAKKMTTIPSSYLTPDDFSKGDGRCIRKKYDLGDSPLVLFIGSKSIDKGTVCLVQAWSIIQKVLPQAKLVIAGVPTSSWNDFKKTQEMTGIIELDYVDQEEKHDLLSACDVLCVPSRTESFGMILLEAWAKSKPVIGGPTGATREMINEGYNGYTVNFGDVKNLAAKLQELLVDKKKRENLGANGHQMAKKFTQKDIIEKTLGVYEQALKQKTGS